MCPVCATNIALLVSGTASGAGLTALTLAKFFRRKQTKQNEKNQYETARVGIRYGSGKNESRNCDGI
jgi:membrane protein implicated in regulation of membrane protease activity